MSDRAQTNVDRADPCDGGLLFVVQQHSARRLHYDFRLEIGGRLVSWAVPKGPSMDPGERRLAVRVEDHPIEHAYFEGVIPPGEYGAGEVIIWDRGTWRPLDDDPEQALRDGKLLFLLGGQKLRGRFVLVRTRYKGQRENWLLIKLKDKYALPGVDICTERPESVVSGRTIADLRLWAAAVRETLDEVPHLSGAKQAPMPTALPPMWPGGQREPFSEAGWLFEIEQVGSRVLAFCDGAAVVLRDSRQRAVTEQFPEVVFALAAMRLPRAVIDGVIGGDRRDAEAARQRLAMKDRGEVERARRAHELSFRAFDLLHFGDFSLLEVPLTERRRLLSKLLPDEGPACFVDHIAIDGQAAADEAAKLGVRAIAKREDSPYRPGERSPDWLIITPPRPEGKTQPAVAAGERATEAPQPTGAPAEISPDEARELADQIRACRHRSMTLRVGDTAVKLTNLDKVFWPPVNNPAPLLKRDLIAYYAEMAPWLLPFLRDRPLTLKRYVDGVRGESFYQRDWHYRAPDFVRLVRIFAPSAGRDIRAVVCDNLPTLLWLANTADIEMHAWYARCSSDGQPWPEQFAGSAEAVEASSLNYPDFVVFDLDPWIKAEADWHAQRLAGLEACAAVARLLRQRLEDLGLVPFVKTSGKTGLHIFVPVERRHRFETTREVARRIGQELAEAHPDLVTMEWRVEKREGKVLIDHMQNVRGKTLPAPYSLRATEVASVSMPLRWDQLDGLDSFKFTLRNVPHAVRTAGDAWAELMTSRRPLDAALKAYALA